MTGNRIRLLKDAAEKALRVVATTPNLAGLFRVDQLVAAVARERLWLTDAYYAGTTAYVQALRAAARDGVDVRLLVPNGTDIPLPKLGDAAPVGQHKRLWRQEQCVDTLEQTLARGHRAVASRR